MKKQPKKKKIKGYTVKRNGKTIKIKAHYRRSSKSEAFWKDQTGPKQTTRGKAQDKKLKAKPPGRRMSKNQKIYYERRRNRSDY